MSERTRTDVEQRFGEFGLEIGHALRALCVELHVISKATLADALALAPKRTGRSVQKLKSNGTKPEEPMVPRSDRNRPYDDLPMRRSTGGYLSAVLRC